MVQAVQRRDKEVLDMRRLCAALEKCCRERNERRVANRLKEVEYSWEMLERVQEEYLASINVTALDDNHVDDLKDVYELKEKETEEISDNYIAKLRDLITFIGRERSRARKSLRIEIERRSGGKSREDVYNVQTSPVYDPCWMSGCEKDHRTRNCPKFKALSRDDKGVAVLGAGTCVFCLGLHAVEGCPMKAYWNPCERNGCGRLHSRLLHGCSTPGLNLHIHMVDCHLDRDEFPGMTDSQGSVMLLIQDVKSARGSNAKIFWDSGSSTVLIKQEFAKNEGLQPTPATYTLTTVGGETKEYDTNFYCIRLVDRRGNCHLIKGYGIAEISSEFKS